MIEKRYLEIEHDNDKSDFYVYSIYVKPHVTIIENMNYSRVVLEIYESNRENELSYLFGNKAQKKKN
jgi:hypothetical protein